MTKLLNVDGQLYHPDDSVVIRVYPEGDCDTISWPFERDADRTNLAVALYGDYEIGLISERKVLLPDGTEFDIDANMP